MSKSLDQVPGNSPRIHGKLYAFLIAFISALGGFLFGYDLAIIGGANVFLEKQFHLSPAEFGLISASAVLGCIIGPFLGAWSCDRFGRRSTLMGACWFLALGSIFTAVPQWLWPGQEMVIFFIFRVVGGLGVGLCSIASPMYTNEIAPARWRGGLGFMYQLAIVVGSVAASLAAWLLAGWLLPEVSWQWMFASELIFVGLFAVLLFLVPESPRWLAERQRIEEAQAIFARIDGPAFARAELVQVEQSLAAESGTLAELFGPSLRIALVVGLCLALFNNYTGWSAMAGYLTKLFELGGLSRSAALGYNLLAWGFMSLATLLACRLVDRVGRRPLWLISSLVMIAANAFLGLLFAMKASVSLLLAAVCFCGYPPFLRPGSAAVADDVGDLSDAHPRPGRGHHHFLCLAGQFRGGQPLPGAGEVFRRHHRFGRWCLLVSRCGLCFRFSVRSDAFAGDQRPNAGRDRRFLG